MADTGYIDQVLADGLLRSLRAAGYAADQVSSGSEADAALADHEFDCVILDLGLPPLVGASWTTRWTLDGSPIGQWDDRTVVDLSELELTNGARLAVEMNQSTTWVRDPTILEKLRGQRKWTIAVAD